MSRVAVRGLTAREVEVLQSAAEGMTNREIGDVLYLSPSTVRSHMHHISTKLGAHSRAQAAAIAVQAGLVHVDVPEVLAPEPVSVPPTSDAIRCLRCGPARCSCYDEPGEVPG